MRTLSLRVLFPGAFLSVQALHAQPTFTQATHTPAPGLIESHVVYYDDTPGTLATTGTANVWDATGVTVNGSYTYSTYYAPSASPYSATYPTATICAQVEGNSSGTQWYHWNVTSSIAELLGFDDEVFIGGETLCEFPFDLGDDFSDTYTIFGSTSNITVEYVASGSIQAPWGTLSNVAMFSVNSGLYYTFVQDDVLNTLGEYVPGYGWQLDEVTIINSICENSVATIGILPSIAETTTHVVLPFAGGASVSLSDACGRTQRTEQHDARDFDLDVSGLAPGSYVLTARGSGGAAAQGRLIVR